MAYQEIFIENVSNGQRVTGYGTEALALQHCYLMNEEAGYNKYVARGVLQGGYYKPKTHGLELVVHNSAKRVLLNRSKHA